MNCLFGNSSMKTYPYLSHFGKCYEAFTKKLKKSASSEKAYKGESHSESDIKYG